MATTTFLANSPITFTSAAASVDRATFTEIPLTGSDTPTGARDGLVNAIRFFCEFTSASQTATLEVVVTKNVGDTERVFASQTATLTAGSQRTTFAGAAGNYIGTVVFTESLNSWFDPVGFVGDGSCRILFGCTTVSSGSCLVTCVASRKT